MIFFLQCSLTILGLRQTVSLCISCVGFSLIILADYSMAVSDNK